MTSVTINLHALRHNYDVIRRWMIDHGAKWNIVTKVLCGYDPVIRALHMLGARCFGDSRLENMRTILNCLPDARNWYLRVPNLTKVDEVVKLTQVSLNSEIETIEALDKAAKKANTKHQVVVMIELGDLREGILPGGLIKFYEEIFKFSNIEVIGIGSNLGCLSGVVPSIDQYMQLALYRELLELKFKRKMQIISAGSSAGIPFILDGTMPKSINHFRIGESLFLGTDLINGGMLPTLRNDVVKVSADVVEIRKKSLHPNGETSAGLSPFNSDTESEYTPGQRGWRALVTMGQIDTDISGLTPVLDHHQVAGGSSDITVVNVGDEKHGLNVGGKIEFRPDYSAMVRLMNGKYVDKCISPSLEEFEACLKEENELTAAQS